MKKRVCIVVLDGVGVGEMPDAASYGDTGSHTLGNINQAIGGLKIPNLLKMGLGNIHEARLPSTLAPTAAYGRMASAAQAKDTTSGHWELMGLVMHPPFKVFDTFDENILKSWLARAGMATNWLGNYAASGTQIIADLGATHMQTGAPIVYTSADSVFQVAAHEEIIPLVKLYELCEIAREMLVGDIAVGRVIARPFTGLPGNFTRTKNRKDFATPPPQATTLDKLANGGHTTLGIGKIHDIFCGRGVHTSIITKNNDDGVTSTINALKTDTSHSVIFTNLIDFDMLYGHRNDAKGFAAALEAFDTKLPELCAALQPNDLLIITADHGCDPTAPHTNHTREYVPILIKSAYTSPTDLGTLPSLAYVADVIHKYLT